MIKLVVFDWNGTLLSDTNAVQASVNASLKFLGHDPITIKHHREISEVPIARIYEKLGISPKLLNDKTKEYSNAFHTAYDERVLKARTRAGTRELLQFLDESNVQKIILSNHTKNSINFQFERLKLSLYFDAILANENNWSANSKGKKDRLVDYLKTVDSKPNEILIIGDSIEEVIIGKELGLHTVAITGGVTNTKRLIRSNPDVLIHKIRDLIKVVKEI
jgi:phosphoglycolate phosphatase-like HAD superfamily hydrolase